MMLCCDVRLSDCSRAGLTAVLLALPLSPAAQQVAAPRPAGLQDATFTIFVRSVNVGTEQIGVSRTATGWTVFSTGRMNAPVSVVLKRLELKYDSDWKPIEMTLDATVRSQEQSFRTVRN